jgi:hypothetical protein
MPKIIIVTILQLFPKTTGCSNFRKMSVGSITAVYSSFVDKISNKWVAYSEIWFNNHQGPILGFAQQTISLFLLLFMLAVRNG